MGAEAEKAESIAAFAAKGAWTSLRPACQGIRGLLSGELVVHSYAGRGPQSGRLSARGRLPIPDWMSLIGNATCGLLDPCILRNQKGRLPMTGKEGQTRSCPRVMGRDT